MRATQASQTAAMVAACRGFGAYLPSDAQLIDDPYGVRFAGPLAERAERVCQRMPWLARAALSVLEPRTSVLWMQLRTRAIDDALRAFVSQGGRQVLLLGAGFDARAARLPELRPTVCVFEVDHPATQARKREVLSELHASSAETRYLSWNFETSPMSELPARLAEIGHDASAPTFTIWEGVTMYLSESAIDATLAAVRALSAKGSHLVFTYIDKRDLNRDRVLARLMDAVGEPHRFGFERDELPAWLAARGLTLLVDHDTRSLVRKYLPARYGKALSHFGRGVVEALVA